jgi:hypothetical protein
MAVISAAATGNWSNTATWNGGVVPTLEDTVYANNYTVTIDQNVDLTGSTVDQSGSFITGQIYEIVSIGTTNFGLTANCVIPNTTTAVSNTVGTIFQAVNAGTATTGTARRVGALLNYANAGLSIAAGGGFTMSGNYDIDGAYIQAGTANCLTFTSAATSTLTACRATGSATNLSTRAISFDSTGTLTCDGMIALGGRVTGGTTTANGPHAVENTSTGTIDFTNASTLTGAIGSWGFAVNNNSTGSVTVTSSTINGGGSGDNTFGLTNVSTGSVTITSCTINGGGGGSNDNNAIANRGAGPVTITSSTITGGSSNTAHGLSNTSTGAITITSSTITGGSGSGATCFGLLNNSTGSVTATSTTITAGSGTNFHGLSNTSTGTIVSSGDITASTTAHGFSGTNVSATVTFSGSFTNAANGFAAVNSPKYLMDPTPSAARIRIAKNGTTTYSDFFTADNSLTQAVPADVRSGTVYADGNLTGTCAVPAAGSVALGVAVDNTTGTAVLTPAAVWDALTSGMTTAGSIGARLKNAATLDSTGQQLADALSPVP